MDQENCSKLFTFVFSVFSKLFTFVFSVLNFVFLKTSLSTRSLNLFKPAGAAFNLPTSESSTFVFKLSKIVGSLVSLLMSSLSGSAFKAIYLFLTAKSDVSTPVP